jgi:CBS domain containing-hemolysin-like protein
MTLLLTLLGLLLCYLASAMFSGSETAFYALSKARLEADLRFGRRMAFLVRWLIRDERAFLIAILIGNNLVLELATSQMQGLLTLFVDAPLAARELLLTLILTPTLFLFGELLPKDVYRRRPHTLLGWSSPLVALARLLFLPLALPLRWLSQAIEAIFRLERSEVEVTLGRDWVIELVEESARAGSLPSGLKPMVDNVLRLRSIALREVMVPFSDVWRVELAASLADSQRRLAEAPYTRLPLVEADGRIERYVHQLEALAAPQTPLSELARPLLALDPEMPVDRALARLRLAGQRCALVGTSQAPRGLVTLKDLVETISGDLAGF